MRKYFGTDGIRGVAGETLTADLSFKVGKALGKLLTDKKDRPKVIIGRDTRISCDMIEYSLTAGLTSVGVDVMTVGVIPTPAIAYLTKTIETDSGIMISASHNPYQDNGIKIFGPDGFKLTDETEAQIEALLDAEEDTLPRPSTDALGTVDEYLEGTLKYSQFLQNTVDSLSGMKVALDGANGATASMLTRLFADLDTDFHTMGDKPNGVNINDGVGSTHPEALVEFVKETGADIGLSFDGDGDRCIAVDENGTIVDGDKIMFILGKHFKNQGTLSKDTIVSTVMSNLGFHKAVEAEGMVALQTAVGDRYVVEEMRKNNYNFGGEQSGHIIILDLNTTGDGLLSGIQLMNVMKQTGKSLSELASEVPTYPQELVNIRVSDKNGVMEVPAIKEVIDAVEAEMDGNGRVLVRPSGTEPLVRVMVEAPTDELVHDYVTRIADVVRKEVGID